jgi:hypothetical protein
MYVVRAVAPQPVLHFLFCAHVPVYKALVGVTECAVLLWARAGVGALGVNITRRARACSRNGREGGPVCLSAGLEC